MSLRLFLVLTAFLTGSTGARADLAPRFLMHEDPEVTFPDPIRIFAPRLGPLWIEALQRPEADMQRMGAEAIARGHKGGIRGLEASVPSLLKVLSTAGSHPAARLAAARALVALEATSAAPQMAEAAGKFGADLRQLIEPALAEWKFAPMYSVWRDRVTAPATRPRDLVLAVRCLGTAGDGGAGDALLALVHDAHGRYDVRTGAARSAGLVRTSGLEAEARRLLEGAAPLVDRLCAAQLVAHHAGEDAQELLERLALDADPAVAVIALQRLIEIDPHLVLPLAERVMQNADPKVRHEGARAYVLVPDPSRVAVLSKLLDDPHPEVRGYVSESLSQLAQRAELDGPVRRSAMQVLAGDGWRGLEQAALLLTGLDHKPAAPRLVELLEFPRGEVSVAAGWGLKMLAVTETLPAMLDKARRNTELRLNNPPPEIIPALDRQMAHLNEAFGRMKYAPAEPLLREYIPKNYAMGRYSRSAAIWSLGLLHSGIVDEELASQLLARATDGGIPPEFTLVREAAAITIGRMRAKTQAEGLRRFVGNSFLASRFTALTRWALIECDSRPIPELIPPEFGLSGWFLEPLDMNE